MGTPLWYLIKHRAFVDLNTMTPALELIYVLLIKTFIPGSMKNSKVLKLFSSIMRDSQNKHHIASAVHYSSTKMKTYKNAINVIRKTLVRILVFGQYMKEVRVALIVL